jgi:hypothetical protein
MPLKQVNKQQYEVLYREALFILNKLCHDKRHTDHEDIAHLTLEFYFIMKRDSKNEVSLQEAAEEALRTNPCSEQRKVVVEHHPKQDTLAQKEAQRDLDKIYLNVQEHLSLNEKYIFCMLLSDTPASVIMATLKMTEVEFVKEKASLIGKLHDAATSPAKYSSQEGYRDPRIGKIKRKIICN